MLNLTPAQWLYVFAALVLVSPVLLGLYLASPLAGENDKLNGLNFEDGQPRRRQ